MLNILCIFPRGHLFSTTEITFSRETTKYAVISCLVSFLNHSINEILIFNLLLLFSSVIHPLQCAQLPMWCSIPLCIYHNLLILYLMNMGDISCALLQNSHSFLLEYMLEFPQGIDLDVKLLPLDDCIYSYY